ncbi:MAG: DUF4270 domain-containing protein [Mediterranea sp.]|jgi:hypothetical protein|nr:DUF4270 domain-containing protein [Mediterranea sp.]
MKAKYLWLALITLVFSGCDDNTGGLGLGMLPESDEITVGTKTFDVITESAAFGSVFAKTDIGYVGRFTDHEYGFGNYEGSFLTELNCVDDLTFPQAYSPSNKDSLNNMISSNIDESFELARIVLGYYNFFGDSLSPMQVSIYELDKKNLGENQNHYTDIDPNEFTTKTKLLGRKSFSAVDLADSLRHESKHLHQVSIPIDDELGKRIIRENWEHPEKFKDSKNFRDVFKGLYIINDIGEGTVLYIQYVQLDVVYKSYQLDSAGDIMQKHNGGDSIYLAYRSFASTMEVIQSNRIQNSDDEITTKVEETTHTYLKSPAGIYTKATLPIGDLINKDNIDLEQDTINSVKLVFNAYYHEIKSEYSMSPPESVLLIREKEYKEFFEKNMIPNSTTSYIAYYSNNQYTFTNIMRLVTSLAKEMEEAKKATSWDENKEKKWLEENATVAIIPISLETQTDSYGNVTITNVRHDLKPAYVRLKGGLKGGEDNKLKLQVVYSQFYR